MTTVATYAGRAARGGGGLLQTVRSAGEYAARRLSSYAPVEDWVTFALLLAMLWSLGWSVWLANWGDLPSLLPTMTVGAMLAFAASRLRTHWTIKLTAALVVGFAVVMWQGSITAEGSNLAARARDAWDRMFAWVQVARDGGISTDTVPFALMFMTASWITAYAVTALTFATRNPWVPVSLLGLGLMTNLSYRQGLHEQTFYLFIIAAVALFAHVTTLRRLRRWNEANVSYPQSLRWLSVRDGAMLAGAVVLIAALLPLWEPRSDVLRETWQIARSPIDSLREPAGRLLAGVRGVDDSNRLAIPSQNLAFRGPISLTEQPLFWVSSRYQTMFPGRVYQQYTSQGWITGPTSTSQVGTRSSIVEPPIDTNRQRLEQVIQPLVSTDLVLPVSGVYELDRPAEVQFLDPPRYTVPLTGPVASLANLPADLREAAFNLRFELLELASQSNRESPPLTLAAQPAMPVETVTQALDGVLPADVEATILPGGDTGGLAMSLAIERASPREQVGVQLPNPLAAEQSYAITTYVVTATDEELAATGDDYPAYITDRYLQLPSSLPVEVRDLANSIVAEAGAVTPYQKVRAIQDFLQDQEYSQEIEGPAPSVDGVYYFLFQTQVEPCASVKPECDVTKIKGYSQYFGSAATVMFRAVGIPARMVSGWAAGDYNPQNGRFLVKDSHRHGWSQAFFPGYGWTDVEVTPDSPPPVRNQIFSVLPANIFSAGAVGSAEEDPDFQQDIADLERLAQQAQELALRQLQTEEQSQFPRWIAWTGVAIIATLIVIYLAWWLSLRGLTPGRRAYTKLSRTAWLLGLGRESNQSPSEYAAQFSRVSPAALQSASRICDAFTIETYARPGAHSAERGELEAAWRRFAIDLLSFRVRQIVGMGPELRESRSSA